MWMLRSPGLECLGFASPLLFYPCKSSDGPIRVGTVRPESAMHPAGSESAGHDPSQIHPGPDPSMFVSDPSHDPSHSIRSESAVISVPDPVCPSHCGLRSTTSLPQGGQRLQGHR
jgi:hypothetical protein